MNARDALKLLRKIAPQMQADFDHIFEPAGGSLRPIAAGLAESAALAGGGRIMGMIDGGVASHPSLAGASIEQNGFAGPPQPTGHGTAVASLLVGNQGPFRGAATGAQLFVADVYGGSEAAGSASAIARALGWLAGHHPQVINISLVGPPNKLVERAIEAVEARGIEVVAAVGNDGPAAPPQYPASYPGVVAVTAVDARGRALPEAGKPTHLDFAAPGADMAAALPGRGYARVRGTSFAAPLAAARLLMAGSPQRLAIEARPGSGHVGRGIVCGFCRIDPRTVGAK
jgi:subtilisin family serine protease